MTGDSRGEYRHRYCTPAFCWTAIQTSAARFVCSSSSSNGIVFARRIIRFALCRAKEHLGRAIQTDGIDCRPPPLEDSVATFGLIEWHVLNIPTGPTSHVNPKASITDRHFHRRLHNYTYPGNNSRYRHVNKPGGTETSTSSG